LGGALAHAHLHKRKERKYKNKDIKMSENMHAAPFWVRQILGEKREDSLGSFEKHATLLFLPALSLFQSVDTCSCFKKGASNMERV
jgi:hypothetical protein